jgi:chemotaxis family two-component system response regulator Rcp1
VSADALRPVEILLVEDDEEDARLTREALEIGKVLNRLTVLSDGAEVIPYLRGERAHTDAPRPDLVLLDLNLPGRDGRQVLADIKDDLELRRIPVVVLTASQAEEDVVRSYDLHANAYVTKPVDVDSFVKVIRKIDEFFISVVRLPPS